MVKDGWIYKQVAYDKMSVLPKFLLSVYHNRDTSKSMQYKIPCTIHTPVGSRPVNQGGLSTTYSTFAPLDSQM